MLKTGREDSSPKWEQQPVRQEDEPTTAVQIPVLATPLPGALLTAPRRSVRSLRELPIWAILQVMVAALVLLGVSVAAALVIRGPKMPAVVHLGPSIVITTSGGAQSGSHTVGPSAPTATTAATTPGVIKFGGGGDTTVSQQCNGIQPLASLSLFLDNSASTVPVDWWVSISQVAPDGKGPWAIANLPYGTLPAGKSTSLTLTPVASLCRLLAGGSSPVTYTADVDYGGVGGFRVTDVVVPGIGPAPTATGSATVTTLP